eukprot:12895421-Prorocentrum_lima.AAC.1
MASTHIDECFAWYRRYEQPGTTKQQLRDEHDIRFKNLEFKVVVAILALLRQGATVRTLGC